MKREIIGTLPIPNLAGFENRLVKLTFSPGEEGVHHTHPVAAMGYIVQGEHESQWEGGDVEYYKKGDVFVDRANDLHIHTSNPSKTEDLIIILSYVIKIGEPNVVMAN